MPIVIIGYQSLIERADILVIEKADIRIFSLNLNMYLIFGSISKYIFLYFGHFILFSSLCV